MAAATSPATLSPGLFLPRSARTSSSSKIERLIEWKWALSDPLSEALTLDTFHRNKQLAVNFIDLMDSADVGMVEGGGSLCFIQEPRPQFSVLNRVRPEKFEGNRAMELGIYGLVDNPIPPSPSLPVMR
jgi:hypothetical protein